MVIVYKESAINWHTLGSLITTDHYGLVNLIAGERIVTELMQDELNGERLAAELQTLLDPEANAAMKDYCARSPPSWGQAAHRSAQRSRFLSLWAEIETDSGTTHGKNSSQVEQGDYHDDSMAHASGRNAPFSRVISEVE